MKLTNLLTKTLTLLSLTAMPVWAQQQDTDNDGVCNPDYSHPAFGAIVDYNTFPQLTDIPSMYITVYKSDDQGVTYDPTKTMNISTTKTDWYYQCRIVIVDKYGKMKQRDEMVGLRGRGNSTWTWVNSGKRPFRLKFADKTKLLVNYDMENGVEDNGDYADAKNWTLLANAFDKTLIHNAFTYELGKNKLTNLPFCPAYRFVDLFVNNVYYGTYQVSDHMQVDPNRVNIPSEGYFLEFSDTGNNNAFLEDPYFTTNGLNCNIKSPDPSVATTSGPTSDPKFDDLKTFITNMYSKVTNLDASEQGYPKYIDIKTLVDWVIGEEIAANYDGTKGNMYAYMNNLSDKLHFGPMWDLDIAYGAYGNMATNHIWEGHDHPSTGSNNILVKLWQDPTFVKALYERWCEVYNNGELLTFVANKIDALATLVSQSQAKNFTEAHPFNSDVTPISTADNMGKGYASYDAAIADFKSFVDNRIKWLNGVYKAQYDALECKYTEPSGEGFVSATYYPNSKSYFISKDEINPDAESVKIIVSGPAGGVYATYRVDGETYEYNSQTGIAYDWSKNTGSFTITGAELTSARTNGIRIFTGYENWTLKVICIGSNIHAVAPCEHSFTLYVDNNDGTHTAKCDKCDALDETSAPHTYVLASGKPKCSACNSIVNVEITDGGSNGDAVYALTNASTKAVTYLTKSFTEPTDNNIYKLAVEPAEGVEFYNTVYPDGKIHHLKIVDGQPYTQKDKYTAIEAEYTRTLPTGESWGTLCLPFKVIPADCSGVKFYQLASVNSETLVFEEATSTGGYTPLVFRKTNNAATITALNTTTGDISVKAASKIAEESTGVEGWNAKGVATQTTLTYAQNPNIYYIAKDQFWHAEGTLNLKPFRAYFIGPSTSAAAKSLSISFVDDDDTVTAVDAIAKDKTAVFADRGSVTIVSPKNANVKVYSLDGKLVTSVNAVSNMPVTCNLASGAYIVNGTKVVVK